MTNIINLDNLSVKYSETTIINDICFTAEKGLITAIVGESGSGKSTLAMMIADLLPQNAKINYSSFKFEDDNIEDNNMSIIRDNIGVIFQNPSQALNPLHPVRKQIREAIYQEQLKKDEIEDYIDKLLEKVQLLEIIGRKKIYPHQLSGGQQQRIIIAIALANKPRLLIADEPTTALDFDTEHKIMELIADLQKAENLSVILVSHNLSLVEKYADYIYVMQSGLFVEKDITNNIINHPYHEYTKTLVSSKTHNFEDNKNLNSEKVILRCQNLKVAFDESEIIKNISFELFSGEKLGIVGKSGSGKSTLSMAILNMIDFSGDVIFNSINYSSVKSKKELTAIRKEVQIVFQDYSAALNPRMNVFELINEGIKVHFPEYNEQKAVHMVENILEQVLINKSFMSRYPDELSGGQKQRVAIARSLVIKPKLLILDEPSSALDVKVQKQLMKLLNKMHKEYELSLIFISHDLDLVQEFCDRVILIKDGEIQNNGMSLKNVSRETFFNLQ